MKEDLPELPIGHEKSESEYEVKQIWNTNGESCPDGTIPIRRTTSSHILNFGSIPKFGKKLSSKHNKYGKGTEHATGFVKNGVMYGAKAILNVWAPNVTTPDYSLLDRYEDGCYNLLCPGFVQIDKTISLGAALTPTSTYNGHQSEITLMLWKYLHLDGWWLSVGKNLLGFWLANEQFPYLNDCATVIEYGGLMYGEYLLHSATQIGSGHFLKEGFRKAAYAKNLEVVSDDSKLTLVSDLELKCDQPFCYDVKSEIGKHWGNHVFFGGPGKSASCTIQTFKN